MHTGLACLAVFSGSVLCLDAAFRARLMDLDGPA